MKWLLICVGIILSQTQISVAEWNQWLGADRDGISLEKGITQNWEEEGPVVAWRITLGEGYSGISYSDGKLFTMFADQESEYLVCSQAEDGLEVWRCKTDSRFTNDRGNGPRCTPTIDGDLVFVLGAKGKLYAVDISSGRQVWWHNLVEEFGSKVPNWGFSCSPLVVDDYLIAEVGGTENRSLLAFDKQNGTVVWSTHTDEAGYSSPIYATLVDIPQVVHLTLKTLFAVNPQTGQMLWSYDWPEGINIATPMILSKDRVFISCSYDKGSVMLKIRQQDNQLIAEEIWKNRRMKNHFNPSIAYNEHLYGFDNSILKCMKADTGKVVWEKRGFGKGSVILANQTLIVLSDDGKLALVAATPDDYKEQAQHQVLEGLCWTIPTLQSKYLYLRNHNEMVCLDLSQ